VLDALRRETIAEGLQLSPAARIERAFTLGDDDLERFARAHGLSRDEALRRLRANRSIGRRPSVANSPRP